MKFFVLTVVFFASLTGVPFGTINLIRIYRGEMFSEEAKNWKKVSATIQSYDIIQERAVGYSYSVVYSYSYAGKTFTNRRDNFYRDWRSSMDQETIRRKKGVIGGIDVFVNPITPEEAVVTIAYYSQSVLTMKKLTYATINVVSGLVFTFLSVYLAKAKPED